MASLPNKIIAHELRIKADTVKVHLGRAARKLECANRTEVALRMATVVILAGMYAAVTWQGREAA